MKSLISGKAISCALSLCALFGATSAWAQDYSIRVDVPFEFMAGEKLYPAGGYNFTVDTAVHTLKIKPQSNKSIDLVSLMPVTERRAGPVSDKGMVQFIKSGSVHVLNGVWKPGAADGYRTPLSKAAMEAAAARGNGSETPSGNGQNPQ